MVSIQYVYKLHENADPHILQEYGFPPVCLYFLFYFYFFSESKVQFSEKYNL